MAKEIFIISRLAAWAFMGEIKVEIDCDPNAPQSIKLGFAVKVAAASRANLSRADLSRAYLSGANLSGANLSRADLSRADLSRANLSRADLSRADLSGADLSGAYLSGANLSGAYLSGAYLSGADLSGADLSGADLSEEVFRPYKADLWTTILSLRAIPVEMRHLIAKLRAGEVDGSTYGDGKVTECACLVGTLAQPRAVSGESLDHNPNRPAEVWFTMIRPGDLPTDKTGGGFAASKALEWTLELAAILGIDVSVGETV